MVQVKAKSTGMYQRAVDDANIRQQVRLAELKRAQDKLELFDAFVPALEAAGLKVYPEEFGLGMDGVLRISGLYSDGGRERRMLAVLLANGMKEVRRTAYISFDQVYLVNGRLKISFAVFKAAEEKAVQP